MSYCFNPACPDPGVQRMRHLDSARFCSNCGAPLQLIERYRATVRVGEGQFGQTFLAVDEATGQRCVVRQMPPPSSDCALLQIKSLRQRSRALRQLNFHPQLPALLAWFSQQGQYYWVSRFVDGPTLEHSNIALGEDDILRLLNDILPLLHSLHGARIYHGDIKPANFILASLPAGSAAAPPPQTHLVGFDFGRPYPTYEASYRTDLHCLGQLSAYLLTPGPRPHWSAFAGQIPTISDGELRSVLSRLMTTDPHPYASAEEAANAVAALVQRDGPTLVPGEADEVRLHNSDAEITEDASQKNELFWTCCHTLQGHDSWVRSVTVSADGRWVISGSGDKTVKIWSATDGELRHTLQGHNSWVRAVAASSDTPRIASASNDKIVQIWDLHRGDRLCTLRGHTDWVRTVTFLPGNRLASAAQDKAILLWDLATAQVIHTLLGHQHWVLTTALTLDGAHLISGSRDRTIRVWDLKSARCLQVLTGHQAEITCLTICPNTGAVISGSTDKTIRYWDWETGECTHVITTSAGINSLAIQAEAQLLAAGSSNKTIGLWTLADRRWVGRLTGHQNWVWSVDFSQTATPVLVSGSWDGTIKLWRPAEKLPLS